MKKQRALLELPLDLSINLAPVDMKGEDSFRAALREHDQLLQEGVKDPLVFGLKKIFEQSYKDFTSFLSSYDSLFFLKKQTEDMKQLDDALSLLVTELTSHLQVD